MLETKINLNNGVLTIQAIGRLDGLTSKEFIEATEKEISQDNSKVILNLQNLDYISSEGLRSVLTTAKKTKSLGGKLILCAPLEGVKEVLDISGFGQMLGVYASEEEALNNI